MWEAVSDLGKGYMGNFCILKLSFAMNIKLLKKIKSIEKTMELPLWLNGVNLMSIYEDTGSIPGLTQWVKDLLLP